MTDKKKRGRPPGSGKKTKVVIVNTESGQKLAYTEQRDDIIASGDTKQEAVENLETMHELVKEYEKKAPEAKYQTTPMSNWALENRKRKLGLKD